MLRSILVLSCSLLTLAFLPVGASHAPRGPVPAQGDLLQHMEGLKKNLKGAAMALQASDDESTLRHIAEMQRLVLLAKLESPPNLEQQAVDERDAHRVGFRRSLALLLQDLAGMEVEILDGEREKAFGRVTTSLFRLREESHAKYQLSK